MDRVIFHIDINHCYAQIEEMKYPKLREIPMAVGGHEEKRHGSRKRREHSCGERMREGCQSLPLSESILKRYAGSLPLQSNEWYVL